MFPRAKLQRFNDITSDVPPPGAYDPKFDSKVKGVGMDKMTERFTEPKSSAESNLQRSASLNALPVFRTPQMPKKCFKKTPSSTKAKQDIFNGDKVRRNIDSDLSSSEDVSSLKENNTQLAVLQEQLALTCSKLEDSEAKCKELENEICAGKKSMEQLECDKEELSKEIDRLIEEVAEQNLQLTSLKESFNMADANLAERKAAVAELEQSKTELLLEMEVLKNQVEQNKNEMDQSVRRCLELEGNLSDVKAQNESLQEIRHSLSNELADLAERLNEATMQVQAREEHCETLEHAKRDLLIVVDEKLQAMEDLTIKIEESEKHSAKLETLLSENKALVDDLTLKNTKLESEMGSLEEKLSSVSHELELCQSKCANLEDKISECKENLLEAESEKFKLISQMSDLEQKLQAVQESLSQTELSLEEEKTRCKQEEAEKEKLMLEVEKLDSLCTELNHKLMQRQQLILGLQADLSSSSCELEVRRAEAERQAKEYQAEIEQICSRHNEELSSVKNNLEKNVADCEAKVSQAQAEHEYEVAKLRDLAYKLEQQVLDERKSLKTLQKEIDEEREEHNMQLQTLNDNINNTCLQRSNLETALSETSSKLQSLQVLFDDLDQQMTAQTEMHRQELLSAHSKLSAAEEAIQEEKKRAKEHIEALTLESERRISEIENNTRMALEQAEIKLNAAEAAFTETLEQVRDDTQALVRATRADAVKELEKVKNETEQKVLQAAEEVCAISNQLHDVQEELLQVTTVKDDLTTSNLDKQMTIVELKDRMNVMETELALSKKLLAEAQDELEAVQNELELMKKIRRNLEIIGHETLATVNAVSKRLLESDDEVEHLSQANAILETTLNEQKEKLTEMEKENIHDIEEMRNNLLEKVESFKQRCIDENTCLQEQIKILQESVEMYAGQLDEANRNVELLEKDRNEQAAVIAELQQTTNELQATQDFLANQVEDYISLKKSHQQLREELDHSKKLLEKSRADAADGEMEIQHREKQIADLTNQLDDLTDKVTDLQGVILELETSAVERDHEVKQLECKLEHQKECALKSNWQIGELTKENEEFRSQTSGLQKELQQLKMTTNQNIEELCNQKADLQSQLDSLTTVLECHKMNVIKARERIETLVNVVAMKESELEEKSTLINNLKDELLSTTNQLSELSVIVGEKDTALLTLHLEADNLRNSLQANKEQMISVSNDLDFEKAFRKECEVKISEMLQDKLGKEVLIEDFKEKLFEQEAIISEKTSMISSMEGQVQDLTERIALLKAEKEDSLNQITEAEKSIVILEANKVALGNDLVSLNTKVSEQWGIIEKQTFRISELTSEVQNQTDLAKYLQTRVEENRKEVAKLEEEKMALQSEISTLKMQNEMVQWENEEALLKSQKQVESQKEEIGALAEQVERIKLEVQKEKAIGQEREEALTEELSSLKISLGAKTQEVGTIRGRNQQLENELDQTTRRKEVYKNAVVELQQAVKQSRSKMSSLEDELKNLRQKLAEEQEEHSRELESVREAASKDGSWEQRYYDLEALVGPFREQLEAFESERQALALRKQAAEGEAKELAQRYAQILGHQNHKQKIHHVLKLKEQIFELKKDNDKLESQTRAQKRTIDKLKDELSRATGQSRFNPANAFKSQDDSLQSRLSLAYSKSLLDSSSLSKNFRVPTLQSTAKKGKENMSSIDTSTPLSTRPSGKGKEEILSPVRHSPARNSPAGSPATPLKEVQNQQQVN